MNLREAAEMALDALDIYREHNEENIGLADVAYEALRQALAQPEQKPIGWITEGGKGEFGWRKTTDKDIPLYTAPPKRELVELTENEFEEVLEQNNEAFPFSVYQQLEAKLKEKNG